MFLRWLLKSNSVDKLRRFIPIISEWLNRVGSLNGAWIKPETYRLFQENGFHLVRNHYYGVLPDTSKISDEWWDQPPYLIPFNIIAKEGFDSIFLDVLQWVDDLRSLPREADNGFYWNNPMFPPLDAMVLYGLMRLYKPKKIIEIGSGFSTEIALLAAAHSKTKIYTIEPFPSERLISLEPDLKKMIKTPVQDVSLETFEELDSGDFLFIDTTHSVKLGSDVNHIIFNVLPHLKSGVIIHIHDIFLPYEYPKNWYNDISIFWNEQYLLLAYLLENPSIEILLPNYLISLKKKEFLQERLKDFDIWGLTNNLGGASGASIWLRKK